MLVKDVAIKYFYAGQAIRRKRDFAATDIKLLPFMSVCMCETGKYLFEIEGKSIELLPGQAILIPSNQRHTVTHVFNENGEMWHKWFFIDAVIDDKYNLDDIFSFPLLLPDRTAAELFALFGKYVSIREEDTLCGIADKKVIAFSLLSTIAPLATQVTISEDDELKQCVDFINAHFLEKIDFEQLYTLMHCSKSSFFDKFRKATGKTPGEYTEQLKLTYAARLLLSTKLSIKEIASKSGFNDQLYFSKRFKKYFKKSPSAYITQFL